MSRTTLANAKAELVSLTASITGVTERFDHHPTSPTGLRGPVSLAVFTAGMDADYWQLGLRLFVTATIDPKQAQDDLDVLMPLIDVATNNGGFGPSNWTIDFPTEEAPFFAATCIFNVGRQDYY